LRVKLLCIERLKRYGFGWSALFLSRSGRRTLRRATPTVGVDRTLLEEIF